MPISTHILPELSLVLRRYSGKITMAEIRQAVAKAHAHPDYRPSMNEVEDHLDITAVDIGFDEMKTFALDVQAYNNARGGATEHIMILSKNPVLDAIEMYQTFIDLSGESGHVHVLAGYPEVFALLDLPADLLPLLPEGCLTEAHLIDQRTQDDT
ncbi:hypothetical protein J7382_18255 [Shimia sp. R11_0]|uniref:Uncharacterized protein n=1 Tax=Shimia marina TaxID=321267 RepID=A0A0P1EQT2_9RHOB|nr:MULTISPECIES: hypothetical protein [Shimia]MBO9479492.1 hypothetical protein [Shimia sp. R11_0]CUH52594.1 hypothetical protein SHM7688_02041 [Shimia marina]SFE51057.1 hypothetical protein SAMN04488037_11093 [Shimia marina]